MRNSANEYLLIEDFSQKKSPAIIMHSEALSNASPFWNLTDPEDTQLAGDFLGLGHSQTLFMDRSSNLNSGFFNNQASLDRNFNLHLLKNRSLFF